MTTKTRAFLLLDAAVGGALAAAAIGGLLVALAAARVENIAKQRTIVAQQIARSVLDDVRNRDYGAIQAPARHSRQAAGGNYEVNVVVDTPPPTTVRLRSLENILAEAPEAVVGGPDVRLPYKDITVTVAFEARGAAGLFVKRQAVTRTRVYEAR